MTMFSCWPGEAAGSRRQTLDSAKFSWGSPSMSGRVASDTMGVSGTSRCITARSVGMTWLAGMARKRLATKISNPHPRVSGS